MHQARWLVPFAAALAAATITSPRLATADARHRARRPPARPVATEDFQWGVAADYGISHPSIDLPRATLEKMARRMIELGVDHVRLELPIKETLDIATRPDHPALRAIDLFEAAGLDVIPVVGVGSNQGLPRGLSVDDPDYVDRVAANVRDIVRAVHGRARPEAWRGDGATGKVGHVLVWQIENELNAAGSVTGATPSWRQGERWWDPAFKLELLGALREAVKAEDGAARVTTNFHGQVSDPVTRPPRSTLNRVVRGLLHGDADLADGLRLLGPAVDEVGLDFYPNYLLPHAVTQRIGPSAARTRLRGALGTRDPAGYLSRRIALYQELTGKPVRVAEIGIPSRSPSFHTPAGMLRFVRATAGAAREAGAIGVTYFRLGDFTPPRRVAENPLARLTDRLLQIVRPNQFTEPYFGLFDAELEPKRVDPRQLDRDAREPADRVAGRVREASAADAYRIAIGRRTDPITRSQPRRPEARTDEAPRGR